MLKAIMNIKRRSLVQVSVFFKKTEFSIIKSIYFHFETQTKQILVCFKKILGKSLVWQKSSATLGPDF